MSLSVYHLFNKFFNKYKYYKIACTASMLFNHKRHFDLSARQEEVILLEMRWADEYTNQQR